MQQLLDQLKLMSGKRANCSVMLCGDFNTNPYGVQVGGSYVAATCVPMLLKYPLPCGMLKSTHTVDPRNGYYTTWSRKFGMEAKHTFDYIFYPSDAMECITIVDPVPEKHMPEARLPTLDYPSHHLSLVAKFRFRSADMPQRRPTLIDHGKRVSMHRPPAAQSKTAPAVFLRATFV